MKRKLLVGLGATSALVLTLAFPAMAQDDAASAVQVNLDNVFVLLCAVLVILMQAGFPKVQVMMGGMQGWKQAGFPTEK